MSNDVVIPFSGSRFQPTSKAVVSSHGWRGPSHRSRLRSRITTARQVVRALVETMSYFAEARVRPPVPPALPAARSTK